MTFSSSCIYSVHQFSFSPKSMQLSSVKTIDFYVSVIDNYGDMGFAVNLAQTLHARYPHMAFRFFCDNENLFRKFFPDSVPGWIGYFSLEILTQSNTPTPSSMICSFFDYKIPKEYLARFDYPKTIVVFSYFLLHQGLESLHATKYTLENGHDTIIHFVPSLLSGGGWIIVNPEIQEGKSKLLNMPMGTARQNFLNQIGYTVTPIGLCERSWISVFVYEKTLEQILPAIAHDTSDTIYWICGNPSWVQENSRIRILPFLSLRDYGVFLSLCDANVVRWENSLCQALLSGKPALWDIYKESNGAHDEKINDYLMFLETQFPDTDWTEYSQVMRGFNEWNDTVWAFSDFVSWYSKYRDVFQKLWACTREVCDLVEKLEEILL